MSGWFWLVGLVATVLVAWWVMALRRRSLEAQTRKQGRAKAEARGRRSMATGRAITDTEFSAESYIPPEALGGGEAPGELDTRAEVAEREEGDLTRLAGKPAEQLGGPVPGPGPWGKVAVPDWEYPLPWSYGQTRLVLLVRDPYWLYSYWEVTGEAQALAEDAVGREAWREARPVLRVYDATAGSHYDVGVDEMARNWHLNVGQPDRTWYAELGRITATGRFVMLARSNTVHTPRDGQSDVIDWRWPPLGLQGRAGMGVAEAMPSSPGVGLPSSPGAPGSAWTKKEAH